MILQPNFNIEHQFKGIVIGIDEVGRGPLSGPVVAAAVHLSQKRIYEGIDDSKKLTKNKREEYYKFLIENSKHGIGIVESHEIDEINILNATFLAMRRAVTKLNIDFSKALVDGNASPDKEDFRYFPVVKGDQKSLSIAAASIIAKVTRDSIMKGLAKLYPCYGWDRNAGYGTREHIEAIRKNGITPYHRVSFLKRI